MRARARARARLRVAALVLALASVSSSCGGGGSDGGGQGRDGGAGGAASSSTSSTEPGVGGLDANGVPTTAAPGSGGHTTATTGRQRRPGVPAAGRYLYRTGSGERDVKALDVYEYPERPGGEVPQLESWVEPSHMIRSLVFWRPDVKVLDREQDAQPDERGQVAPGRPCDYEPDVTEFQFPLSVGRSWSSKSTCQTGDRTKERTASAKVTSTDTVTVEGHAVPVVVIERTVVDIVTLEVGPATKRVISTDFFSAELGLLVRSTGSIEQDVAGQRSNRTFRLDLTSTRPSPLSG